MQISTGKKKHNKKPTPSFPTASERMTNFRKLLRLRRERRYNDRSAHTIWSPNPCFPRIKSRLKNTVVGAPTSFYDLSLNKLIHKPEKKQKRHPKVIQGLGSLSFKRTWKYTIKNKGWGRFPKTCIWHVSVLEYSSSLLFYICFKMNLSQLQWHYLTFLPATASGKAP